jgi:hypothetical protein
MLHTRSLTIHTDQKLIDALAKDLFIARYLNIKN